MSVGRYVLKQEKEFNAINEVGHCEGTCVGIKDGGDEG